MRNTPLPIDEQFAVKSLDVDTAKIDKICLALGLYILLVIFPAYQILRSLWLQTPIFDLGTFGIAATSALCFGIFARHVIRSYLILDNT